MRAQGLTVPTAPSVVLATGADPDAGPATVEGYVAALAADPVVVRESMGNGHTAEVREAITAKADELDVPVYVVLGVSPTGLPADRVDEELATLLHAEIGEDGVYIVHTTQGAGEVRVFGELWEGHDRDDQVLGIEAYSHAAPLDGSAAAEAAITLDLAAQQPPADPDEAAFWRPALDDEQLATYESAVWQQPDVPYVSPVSYSTGLPWMWGFLVAVLVAAVAYRGLQALGAPPHVRADPAPARRSPAPARPPTPRTTAARVARTARHAHRGLGGALDDVARRDPGHDGLDQARHCHEAAGRRLDSPELAEVVAALVLARTGRHALATEPDAERYRCCYLNPLHGEAVTSAPLDRGASVPACRRCADALAEGERPDALVLDGRPYYEDDTTWSRSGFGAVDADWWRST